MSAPTAYETYMLELINRARADPNAEAARYGIDLNANLPSGTISATSKEPLAFSLFLNVSADNHSQSMLDDNYFSHTGSDGSTATQRIFAAGWTSSTGGWSTGENLAYRASTGTDVGFNAATIDNHHEGLFLSSGHRKNILGETFSEIGVGQKVGAYTGSDGFTFPNASMLTENFADGGRMFLTGVVINDADADQFYDIGEGLGSVIVTAAGASGTFTTTSWDSGAYALELSSGSYTVTFSGGTLGGTITKQVSVSGQNVKVDARTDDLDGAATAGHDTFTATSGNDTWDGLAGRDTVVLAINRDAATITHTDTSISVTGSGIGSDQFVNVERLQFNDGTLAFDLDGNAGQTYRLYKAAFDRSPDNAGLSHNIGLMDQGLTIFQMADAFIKSAEFQQTYGVNVDDTTFITLLYQNVLDRAPDATGLAGWQSQLASGENTREGVLFGFSESSENKMNVASAIDDGIFLV
jgi:serralysin